MDVLGNNALKDRVHVKAATHTHRTHAHTQDACTHKHTSFINSFIQSTNPINLINLIFFHECIDYQILLQPFEHASRLSIPHFAVVILYDGRWLRALSSGW